MIKLIFNYKNLFIWLFLVHAAYFLWAWQNSNIYTQDSTDYLSQAENIIKYNSLYAAPWNEPVKPDWFTFRPPVYALFILLCKFIYNSNYTVLLVQSILSLLSFWLVTKLLKRLKTDELLASAALFLISVFYPSQFIHCNLIMSDILFQFLLLTAFYFSVRLWVEPNWRNSTTTAIIFSVAMLTKPVSFLMGFTLVAVLFVQWLRKKKLQLLLPFLLLPITYHSYCSYNKYVTGYYHYTSVTPYFVLKYMGKYTNAQLYGEHFADSVQDEIMLRVNAAKDFKERYSIMNNEGKSIISNHKLTFVWFNIKGWFSFFIDPGRFDWYRFLNINEGTFPGLYHLLNTEGIFNGLKLFFYQAPILILVILALSLLFNLVLLALFVWFILNREIAWYLKLLVFIWVGYIVFSTGVLGLARYRIAVAPVIWLAVIFVLNQFKFKTHVR